MPYQVKTEAPVEALALNTVADVFAAHQMLYDFGYRGSLSTTGADQARVDMVMDGMVPISAHVSDFILYRVTPSPHVVACKSDDQFAAEYESI